MIIFMALADGESRLLCGPLTLHTETAIHIAEKMTGAKFKVSGLIEEWEVVSTRLHMKLFLSTQVEASPGTDNSWLITCKGIGFRNPVSIAP